MIALCCRLALFGCRAGNGAVSADRGDPRVPAARPPPRHAPQYSWDTGQFCVSEGRKALLVQRAENKHS